MEWKYINPPTSVSRDDDGNVIETSAIIQCDTPYTILSGKLKGDWTNRDKADVIDAVLEYNHKLLFVDRAMAESVLEVETLKKKSADLTKALETANETIDLNRKAFSDMIIDFTRLEDMIYELADHAKYNFEDNEVIENDEQTIEEE